MHEVTWRIRPLGIALLALLVPLVVHAEPAATPAALRVGMAPNYPPLAFKDANGQLAGIEVDFAERLGKALGRPIELVETEWEMLGKALEEKTIDLVMSGTSITERRKQRVNFTVPYLTIGQMAIVRAEDYPRLRDPAAIDQPQSRVGFVSRTTGEDWARATLKKAKLHGYANTEEGVAALESDQIDFFIQDAPAVWRVTGGFKTANPKLRGIYRPLTEEQLGWAVPKDDPELLKQLNAVLEQWQRDGTIDDVLDDWITVKKTAIEVKPQE